MLPKLSDRQERIPGLTGTLPAKQDVRLGGTFLAATFANLLFVGPSEVLAPFVVKHVLGAARDLGLIFSSAGLALLPGPAWSASAACPAALGFMYLA